MVKKGNMAKIIVFEPRCEFIAHQVFNAGIVSIMGYLYPPITHSITFYAEKTHFQMIQKDIPFSVNHVEIQVPHGQGKKAELQKIFFDYKMIKKIKKQKPDILICTSVSPSVIYFAKVLLKQTKVVMFFHLLGWLERHPAKFYQLTYWTYIALEMRRDNCIQMVNGESIVDELKKQHPKAVFGYLDHPQPLYSNKIVPLCETVKFGFLAGGARYKGAHLVFDLEKELQEYKQRIEFYQKGCFDSDIILPSDTRVHIVDDKGLVNLDALKKLVCKMNYCVFFYPSESYRLGSSGALVMALANLKPVIAIRNPYFEYVFKKMGNIGYLCNTFGEMVLVIKNILKTEDNVYYAMLQNNIKKGMKYFSTEYLAEQMQKIISKLSVNT
jgi:glycosyltransferase involved in cell wall biosynthesis